MLKIKLFMLMLALMICGCASQSVKIGNSLSVPYGYSSDKDNSEANKVLIDFPNKIPGAKFVDKFLIADASFLIVHIRQAHLSVTSDDDWKKHVTKVQKDIYKILSFLAENNNINSVYVEGVLSIRELNNILHLEHKELILILAEIDSSKVYINMLENTLNNEQLVNILYQNKKDLIEKINLLKKDLEEKQQRYNSYLELKEKHMVKGSAFILASEGKINILAFESSEGIANTEKSLNKYIESFDNDMDNDFIFNVVENRENIFIEKVVSSKDIVAVCVLGGMHAFGGTKSCGQYYPGKDRLSIIDNIYYWNKDNPDKKISLIEITPESY